MRSSVLRRLTHQRPAGGSKRPPRHSSLLQRLVPARRPLVEGGQHPNLLRTFTAPPTSSSSAVRISSTAETTSSQPPSSKVPAGAENTTKELSGADLLKALQWSSSSASSSTAGARASSRPQKERASEKTSASPQRHRRTAPEKKSAPPRERYRPIRFPATEAEDRAQLQQLLPDDVTLVLTPADVERVKKILLNNKHKIHAWDTESKDIDLGRILRPQTALKNGSMVAATCYVDESVDFGNGPRLFLDNRDGLIADLKDYFEDEGCQKVGELILRIFFRIESSMEQGCCVRNNLSNIEVVQEEEEDVYFEQPIVRHFCPKFFPS